MPMSLFVLRWCRRHFVAASLAGLIVLIQIVYNPVDWRRVDHFLTFQVMTGHFRAQERALRDAGVVLPLTQVDFANDINTHAALRELLIRRELRARTLQNLELAAKACDGEYTCPKIIPKVIYIPNLFHWKSCRPGKLMSHNYTLLQYDEMEMRQLVQDTAAQLHPEEFAQPVVQIYDRLAAPDKIHLWSFCAVYLYGGIFVATRKPLLQPMFDDFLFKHDSLVNGNLLDSTAVVVVEEESATKERDITLLAATPRHGLLGCILLGLEEIDPDDDQNNILHQLLTFAAAKDMERQKQVVPFPSSTLFSRRNDFCTVNACQNNIESASIARDFLQAHDHSGSCAMYMHLVRSQTIAGKVDKPSTKRALVEIRLRTKTSTDGTQRTKQKKITLQSQMRKRGVQPGWFCNRCLNWAALGTFDSCKRFCSVGYEELICDFTDSMKKEVVNIDVKVRGAPSPATTTSKAIPPIIHQTWFEDITFDRYPQLARIQASWRNSGWDFRFYTDESARKYIIDNYPFHFLEAFDALIHGAYKADLFRYLVLLKDGGVYSDVDVKLDTSLEAFITPSMTFFAPRDIPCEYAGEPFCLWNGLIGAAPGNPVIVRAVERLVNLIRERADIFDMEREICVQAGSGMEVWKVRAQPLLFLSGPCALGVAMNEALGRASLQSFPIGWIGMDTLEFGGRLDHGDALVMVGDKYDLGEFRISDPESGVIVASTDIFGLDKSPREWGNPTEAEIRRSSLRNRPLPHYSDSKRGVSVWGTAKAYKDDLVANERIQLNVQFIN